MRQRTSKRLAEPNTFEEQIESSEQEAQEKYYTAIQEMQTVALSDWFNRLLEVRIIPTLEQIGFDEQLCWALFKMTAPAWELMGPITDEDVWFHPILIKDIEEIRSGILSKARKNSENSFLLTGMNPQGFIRKSMDPENLFSLFEDISLPWIILPRAYDHLEVHHSQYLLGYLKYLDKEKDSEFGKILARIIIEFVGNYTLKYLSAIHPKDRMIEVLFYGFAMMFWKNLKNPPNGFEDYGIFENFLRWAIVFQNRLAFISCDMAMTIECMEDGKEKVFPVMNAFGLARDSHDSMDSFLVALRHGSPGIEAVIEHFSIGNLLKNATNGRIPNVAVPKALSGLFQKIKKIYPMETPKTQGFIRDFLLKLRAIYDLKQNDSVSGEGKFPAQLRFVGPRVLSMTHDLAASIN